VSVGHRIRSLDGLRGISIAAVLIGHLAGTRNSPVSTATAHFWALAELGVRVFFVLSGFLITGLLLAELSQNNTIQLGRFYFRRTLRIFPAYYAFMSVLVVTAACGAIQLMPGDVWHAATYTSNYHSDRSWFFGHTWSLSVEEQFYLLWPALLLLTGRRRGFIIAAAVVVACPILRLVEWESLRLHADGIGERFETVADAMAIGCVLAGLRPYLHQYTRYRRFLGSALFLAIPLVGLAGNLTHDHPLVHFGIGMTVANIAVALGLDWCVTFSDGRVGRVLNCAPLVYIGGLSYSLYLWQQPFLNRASTATVAAFPFNIVGVVCCAIAAHYLVERPSLRLRHRLESRSRSSVTHVAAETIQAPSGA